jgi:hypothetical protein
MARLLSQVAIRPTKKRKKETLIIAIFSSQKFMGKEYA